MKRIIMTACLCALSATHFLMQARNKTVELRIVQTSDVHGCFFPYDYVNRKPQAGTIARVCSYVQRLRNDYGQRLLLLDNGDILQGQPVSYYSNYVDSTQANIAAQVANYLHYDAVTMGNHDVETGPKVYNQWVKDLHCPVLGANVVDEKTHRPYLKPYIVIEREGVRIAIIGLITPAIPNWLPQELWKGLRFDDMVTTARHWMKVVQEEEKPDVVIGLFHAGRDGGITTADYEEDASLRVAKEVPGFDVVLFGHDHTRHQETVINTAGKEVLLLDPANNALTVADATLQLVKNKGRWSVKSKVGQLVNMTNEPVDKQYMAHFQPYIQQLEQYANATIGHCTREVDGREAFFGNSAFNDFILNLELKITGADIAFNAPLTLRSRLPKGEIRVSDMFSLYKFENQLYVMRLTGEEIRRHLEMSYDQWVNTMTSADDHLLLLSESTKGDAQRLGFKNMLFNFDSAAGIDYEVDVRKPDGQKVRILRMSNGQPFDEKRFYTVAINSYRGNGGGELLTKGAGIPRDSLESRIVWRTERDQRYYLMEAIRQQGTIDPQPNHNWRFVPEEWVKPAAQRDWKLLFGTPLSPMEEK